MKVELNELDKQVLRMEVNILKRLQGVPQVCQFIGCGKSGKVNFMVMSLLGPNLSELRKRQPDQKFSMSTVLRLAVQIISAVKAVHNCGFLHRDLKPSNFAMGANPENSHCCYIIDFGLSRQYTTPTGELRQPRAAAGFRGTVRYASVNAHMGQELGRHDDLWSVFYLLVELSIGHLPWRKIKHKEESGDYKRSYDHKKLTRGLPVEFMNFLDYITSLNYFVKPEYDRLIGLFDKAIARFGILLDDPFDWELDENTLSGTNVSTTCPLVNPPASFQQRDCEKDSTLIKHLNQTHTKGKQEVKLSPTLLPPHFSQTDGILYHEKMSSVFEKYFKKDVDQITKMNCKSNFDHQTLVTFDHKLNNQHDKEKSVSSLKQDVNEEVGQQLQLAKNNELHVLLKSDVKKLSSFANITLNPHPPTRSPPPDYSCVSARRKRFKPVTQSLITAKHY